jgi:hypothetical protein
VSSPTKGSRLIATSTCCTPSRGGRLRSIHHQWTHAVDACGIGDGCTECYVHRLVNSGARKKETELKQRDLNNIGFSSWLCSRALKNGKWRAGCVACETAYVKLPQTNYHRKKLPFGKKKTGQTRILHACAFGDATNSIPRTCLGTHVRQATYLR